MLARELPKAELKELIKEVKIPVELLVYGATVIHHSKRPLLQNYFNFIKTDSQKEGKNREASHFISEPKDEQTHYSIFEDRHGTHIFANDDVNMMTELGSLFAMGFETWKLDGIFCPGQNFVEIAKLFVQAKELLEQGTFTYDQAFLLDEQVRKLHPAERGLDTGFYEFDRNKVK